MAASWFTPQGAKQHVHFIGIGGTGLSAIARVLLESGYTVTGSDRTLSPLARELAAAGARVYSDHSPENINGADVVVRSSAVADDNVEVRAAQSAGIPVLKRAQFLGSLMAGHRNICVAGTHGKTTITAMIAWALVRLGLDPSYIIGSTAANLHNNAHAGQGTAFVIEADEYDRMFLGLEPDVIVVSYLEHDHPDCFPTPEEYFSAFVDFVQRLHPGGVLLVSHDLSDAHRLAAYAPAGTTALTYGTSSGTDYTAENLTPNALGGFDFRAVYHPRSGAAQTLAQISLQAPGEHNVRNSLAALTVIHQTYPNRPDLLEQAAAALGEFRGTGRRFELLGEVGQITIIDDYAHHPTEIQATLAAARARYPQRRIWAVWQPHTYSRTRTLMEQYTRSFSHADRVIITEIYPAREKAQDFDNLSAARVVDQMQHPHARFAPTLLAAGDLLLEELRPGDVLLVLSAGDANTVSARVLAALKERTVS